MYCSPFDNMVLHFSTRCPTQLASTLGSRLIFAGWLDCWMVVVVVVSVALRMHDSQATTFGSRCFNN